MMKSKEAVNNIQYMLKRTDNLVFYKEEIKAIENALEVLECFKKYFNFKLVFEKNQTYLVFKSKERYLPVDDKLSVSNKYYEPLKEWLENE